MHSEIELKNGYENNIKFYELMMQQNDICLRGNTPMLNANTILAYVELRLSRTTIIKFAFGTNIIRPA